MIKGTVGPIKPSSTRGTRVQCGRCGWITYRTWNSLGKRKWTGIQPEGEGWGNCSKCAKPMLPMDVGKTKRAKAKRELAEQED